MIAKLSLGTIAALAMGLAAASPSAAETYPARPITMVVPFPPGGPTDVMARLVAERMSAVLGQNIVIDNRPGGAGGTIGAKTVATAEPNGYTILFSPPGPLAVNAAIYKTLDYDPAKSFAPVALIGKSPQVAVVIPAIPATSLQELVAYAKANPRKLSFAHPGFGTQPHLLAELLRATAKIEIVTVPYRGSGPAVTDLLAGQVQTTIDSSAVLLPHIEAGKLRALAVAGETRSPRLASVPTTAEAGFPYLEAFYWSGIVAPAGTPADIITKLNAAVSEGLKPAEVRERLATLGAEATLGSPQDFAVFLTAEREKWSAVVKSAGIKAE